MTYTLFGMAGSLYTARARSYMRTNAVPFTEVKAGSEDFARRIVPAIGRWIIPVLETPSGEIIQDGADIIDHLDAAGFSRRPIYPEDGVLLAVAHLFELFGAHGLLRPAMHYRWNFDETNLPFLRDAFRDVLPSGLSREAEDEAFARASGRMRGAGIAFGVTPQTYALVEESYARFLALLQAHLRDHPFILGGHPTIADYGLIGAMYAHLGRDPAPLQQMQVTAPCVFRWTERMNMAEAFVDEALASTGGALFSGGDLPETLRALLRFIADDYLPEIAAHVAHANACLNGRSGNPANAVERERVQAPILGMAGFEWRGTRIETVVIPYRFYLLQRLHDAIDRQDDAGKDAALALFAQVGLDSLVALRTARRLERRNNREVWGDPV